MKCKVLTEGRWQRFLDDELCAEESRAINEHLGEDCPDCEEFFMALDSATHQQVRRTYNDLVGSVPTSKKSSDARRLVRSLYRESAPGAEEDGARPIWNFGGGAVPRPAHNTLARMGGVFSILVIAVGGLPNVNVDMVAQRDKGIAPAIAASSRINLDFMIGRRLTGGQLDVTRGVNGASYRPDELLLFRFNIDRSGYVYLVQIREDEVNVLYPGRDEVNGSMVAGQHQLSDPDGQLLAFPLERSGGRRVIVGIFSPTPLTMPQDLRAVVLNSIGSSGKLDRRRLEWSLGKGVSTDSVYFDVGA